METRETIEVAGSAPGAAQGTRIVPVTDRIPAVAPGTAQGGVARLLAVGVGGGGLNAINHMIAVGVHGVEFYAMNTDAQALQKAATPNRLRLGETLTRGLGAGGNPDVGRHAAEESFATIREALTGADMVFITAGMGGGTGTGASPLVAQAAREVGALAVAIVTTPFAFERKRMRVAQEGVEALREVVDALIVVPNARLTQLAARDLSAFEAFRLADDVLRQGIQGISDLITIPGLINLDFADIRNIMTDAGSAHMSVGAASGEGRAIAAARNAITNPLLEVDVSGARGIVFNISGGDDLTMSEVNEIADLITSAAHPSATITFGTVYDPAAKGELKVTVVATGFEAHVIRQYSPSVTSGKVQRWSTTEASSRSVNAGDRADTADRRPISIAAARPAAEQSRADERAPAPSPRLADPHEESWQPPYQAPLVGAAAGPPPRAERVIEASSAPRTDQRAQASRAAMLRPPQESTTRPVTRAPGHFGDAYLGSDDPPEDEQPAPISLLRRIFVGR